MPSRHVAYHWCTVGLFGARVITRRNSASASSSRISLDSALASARWPSTSVESSASARRAAATPSLVIESVSIGV